MTNTQSDEPKQEAPMRMFIVITGNLGTKVYSRDNLVEKWELARKKGDKYFKTEMCIFLTEIVSGVVDIAKVERCQDIYQKQFKSFDLTKSDGKLLVPTGVGISDIGGKG
jgi:hypothetical protein